MSDAADNYDKYQILEGTNEGDYHSTTNPLGWDADGLPENLRRFSKAVANVGREVRSGVASALAAANQSGAWKRLANEDGSFPAISRLADNQVAIAGDWASLLVVNRAVKPSATSTDSGWITAVAYDVANNRTVITETGWVIAVGISELWFGLEPKNAPKPKGGGDPVLATIYHTSDY